MGQERTRHLKVLLSRIEAGFEADALERLCMRLDLTLGEMASLLGLSVRTLGRRLEHGRLTAAESNRLYRYARLFERAVDSADRNPTTLRTNESDYGY